MVLDTSQYIRKSHGKHGYIPFLINDIYVIHEKSSLYTSTLPFSHVWILEVKIPKFDKEKK